MTSGSGTVGSANVTDIAIACVEPRYRLGSQNWGELSVRVTDDLQSLASGATATPRIIVGNNTQLGSTQLDSIALDAGRDLIYAPRSGAINVFANASTAAGNLTPTRRIVIANESDLRGTELDAARDRLYVTGAQRLYVFDAASTLDGTITPTASVPLDNGGAISLDRRTDRLYVGGNYTQQMFVFDNASALTSSSTPTRTVSWTTAGGGTGFPGPATVSIDACRDRLYMGSNASSPAGFNMFVFDAASTLNGVINPQTASVAQLRINQCISSQLDSSGRLYCWPDSPTLVWIYDQPEAFVGDLTPTPSKVINGVVASGYGLDVVAY